MVLTVVQQDENIINEFEFDLVDSGRLDSIESTVDFEANGNFKAYEGKNEIGLEANGNGERSFNSIESRLVECGGSSYDEELKGGTAQLDLLLELCERDEEVEGCKIVCNCNNDLDFLEENSCFGEFEVENRLICCPLCRNDISELSKASSHKRVP